MFFEPKYWKKGEKTGLNSAASAEGQGYAGTVIEKLIRERGTAEGGITAVKLVKGLPEDAQVAGDEAYALIITPKEAVLYGNTDRALIYAAVTLQQMSNHEGIFTGRLEDEPDCGFRGYRVYLPGRNSFREFFDMVDTIVYYKYNYLSLEIGGAMEYKRHPEINEAWKAFAEDTHRYSGRTGEIQKAYPWAKNSIHTDNGEGDILTQDEVRTLIAYARERGLTVYPEVPTLSHTDYICLAHPELREREEDPYPDTYCPSNPAVYPIVFDILEEVIEVFQPELVNIGHDEYYSMCLCPRCRDKKPHDVFAGDVIKIHDWLAKRGIRTAMWGDKLLPVVTPDGRTYGGAGYDRISTSGHHYYYPPTFYCQSMLPKDILMINWYYSFGIEHDFVYHKHGYETVFGNMSVDMVELWRDRRHYGVKGGSCSNWGSNHPEYMQRNGQYKNLIFGAFALWSEAYSNARRQEVMDRTFREAFHLHYGNIAEKPYITVTHTTSHRIPYRVFYDGIFIENEKYHMGHYKVTYTDGTEAFLEVKYGTNISHDALSTVIGADDPDFDPETSLDNSALGEIAYSTIPKRKDGRTWFTTAYPNPYPEKEIRSFEYLADTEAKVDVLCVEY
ncbi:MAG: family 20 glycosylhydrolase [Clostridia bacterium]|nr:family 20 glycosylhydrolase [Clostridia bacterium]